MTGSDHTNRRTLSEIGSTCQKAARGAGCLWGLAEEAGTAARILESAGLPGSECVAAILSSDRVCPCTCLASGPVCGIAAAAGISDRIQEVPSNGSVAMGEIVGPILMAAPLVLAARRTGFSYMLSIDGVEFRIGCDGIEGNIANFDFRATATAVAVARSEPPQRPSPFTPNSREISIEAWRALEALAAETLVPESAQSRSSGAGPDA